MLKVAAESLIAIAAFGPNDGDLLNFSLNAATCGAEAVRGPGKRTPEPEGEGPPREEPANEEPPNKKPGCCFAAGTPVHTDRGDVPIEEIGIGDEILSRNQVSGALEYEPVTALTPLHEDHLLDFRIEGDAEVLRPSTHHPFWVMRGDSAPGWISAGLMQVGDLVQTINGQWNRVASITDEKKDAPVYNFTVDRDHDYFVGQTGFLVHNAPCDRCGTDLHHIVAQHANGVADARGVLAAAGLGVHDPRNPVSLPRCFHQCLHKDIYYRTVNQAFVTAGPANAAALLSELSGFLADLADECGCPVEP